MTAEGSTPASNPDAMDSTEVREGRHVCRSLRMEPTNEVGMGNVLQLKLERPTSFN